MRITLDCETRSYADLMKVGAWAYSQHPTTEVICVCYGIDTQPVQCWVPEKFRKGIKTELASENSKGMPRDLYDALTSGAEIEAHNVSFERSIWENVLRPRGWVSPGSKQWADTMAVACYYALPAKLDRLARALKFEGKDGDGGRLISKYSKLYLKTAKPEIPPEDVDKWLAYCKRDVLVEQAISDWLGDLPERERAVFHLDQTMNLRGLHLDLKLIEAATAIVEQAGAELEREFKKITGGIGPNQRDKVLAWFEAQGLKLDNMQADYLQDVLDDNDLPQSPARRALEIRLQINKASTKKLDAMARCVGTDGRARFQTRYHGAMTGRNTGSGFQPLNLNRGYDGMDPEQLSRDIMYGDADWLRTLYGDPIEAVGKASRYCIKAQDGNKIIAGDFVSIEAVLLACLAGEEWKIEAFRNKHPMYEVMACKIHGFPAEEAFDKAFKKKHPAERQDGKTGELAFGYQGALNAWLKFDSSGRHTDERIIEICKAWRVEHPSVVAMWRGLEDAAIEAVHHAGRETSYRQIGFEVVDEWLSMILPNGKRIWYYEPEIRAGMPHWHQPMVELTPEGLPNPCHTGDCTCKPVPKLTYMAQKGGQWRRVPTYGGKLTENATQATSREILVPVSLALEARGYCPILTVYDEVVCEPPKTHGSPKEFEEIALDAIAKLDWAAGWPVRLEVWEGARYKK